MKNDSNIELIVGNEYKCLVNDIVSEWSVKLKWLGDGWSHETENVDGYYPCIVEHVIQRA